MVEKARFDTHMEALQAEVPAEMFASIKGKRNFQHVPEADAKIAKLKNQLEMIGGMDDLTMKEYQETEQRYAYLSSQVSGTAARHRRPARSNGRADRHIRRQFSDAFTRIDEKFQSYFRTLFNGGRAYLSAIKPTVQEKSGDEQAEDEPDAAEPKTQEEKILAKYQDAPGNVDGIDIKATPPGKKLSSISALSGGERALTSIALLSALLSCFPSPFVVLDEVDAALDEANTIRFAEILGTLASQTQFVTVSHNRETMRKAHTLYGITMGDDSVSKVISLKIDQAQAYAK